MSMSQARALQARSSPPDTHEMVGLDTLAQSPSRIFFNDKRVVKQ